MYPIEPININPEPLIAHKKEEKSEATTSFFQMKIQEYAIKNSRFVFNNAQSNMRMESIFHYFSRLMIQWH